MKKMVLVPWDQYMHLKTGKTEINNEEITKITEKQTNERLSCDMILKPFGKHQIRNAETLLRYVENNMDWNDIGEIIIKGQLISGSHVTDLLKDCLNKGRKWEPTGCREFYNSLKDVPMSLVLNTPRRLLIGKGENPSLKSPIGDIYTTPTQRAPPLPAPPPGVPINKRAINLKRKSIADQEWISNWMKL